MLIGQFFKSLEMRHMERDWLLAWQATSLPEPRPSSLSRRGLSHPSEYAAGIARIRELNLLNQYRSGLAPGGAAASSGG